MADTWRIAGVLHAAAGVPYEGTITVSGGRIVAVERGVPAGQGGSELMDVRPWAILPGFIDLHIHGGGGWDVAVADDETVPGFGRFLASQGTTAYNASLAAAPVEALSESVRALGRASRARRVGARLLGVHLESPFLNRKKKGAMPPEYLIEPDRSLLERWWELSGGSIRQVTIAPELPGALDAIRWLAARGIVVSGGHTDATYEEAMAGIDAGISLANHTYNAMRGLDHRAPGALGAFLSDPRVASELICDALHVHPGALRLALEAKGPERICVISDAVGSSKLPPGEYHLLGHSVTIRSDGTCRLPDGTLAGSTFHQIRGVKVLHEQVGIPLGAISRYTSENPARVAGVGDRKGRLLPGYDADLVVLDEHLDVRLTAVEGEIAYRGEDVQSLVNPKFKAMSGPAAGPG